jgi:hypothetical protein
VIVVISDRYLQSQFCMAERRITDVLRSLNTLNVEQHQGAAFDALIQAVQGRPPRKS